MAYDRPVLARVGSASRLVLGYDTLILSDHHRDSGPFPSKIVGSQDTTIPPDSDGGGPLDGEWG